MTPTRRAALGVATALAALGGTALPARAGALPRIRGVRIETLGDGRMALIVEQDGPSGPPTTFALSEPSRLVADFAASGIALHAPPEGSGPVRRVRYARRGEGVVRVVLDLEREARFDPAEALDGGGYMLPLAGATTAAHPKPRGRVVRVAIDAGHGGRDPGAIGVGGAREKDVTLAAALALAEAVRRRGHEPILTRKDDTYIPLFERVAIAREARADLFISLHADAHANAEASGASVYTLSEQGEARALSVAQARDWTLDLAEPPRSRAVKGILLDLAQRETTNRSADFAQVAIQTIAPIAPLLRNTHRNAGFAVLLAPDVPAILLEMGFLTNATDEARLVDPAARAAMMEALAEAVDSFFAAPLTFAGS